MKSASRFMNYVYNFNITDITMLLLETTRKRFVVFTDQAVSSATNFLTVVIIARTCSKYELGLYSLGFTIILVITGMGSTLITSPYMVYSSKLDAKDNARYSGSTLIHLLGLAGCMIIILSAGELILGITTDGHELAKVLRVLALVITFISLREYCRQVCFARLKFREALFIDMGIAVIQISALSLLGYYGMLSTTRAYLTVGSACGVISLAWLISRRKTFAPRLSSVAPDLVRNWDFGKWLLLGSLAQMISTQSYAWVLACFHGTAATGVLAACMGVIFLGNPFLIGLGNYLGPESVHAFANSGPDRLRHTVNRAMIFIPAIMGIFCVSMLFWGGSAVNLLYGGNYSGNGMVVGILALRQLVESFILPINIGLLAMGHAEAIFKANLVYLVVTVTLGFLLVRSYGPLGVAYGLLSAELITSKMKYSMFHSSVRKPIIGIT